MTALLFEREQVDEIDDWASRVHNLGRDSILWVDLDRSKEQLDEAMESLDLAPACRERLLDSEGRPFFGDFATFLHVTVFVPTREETDVTLERVECLVAERWVVTVHETPIEVFDDYRRRAEGSGDVGRLDGVDFLAGLLEWVLEAYLRSFEAVELALEELDTNALEGSLEPPEQELRRLVELRRDIGRLRRALVSHRQLFLALARPELEAITRSDHADRFAALRARLEDVVQAARDSRDSIVGSFDIIIARTEQRTNEIVKVLTLGSLLLLPGALLAGIMGMNFRLGIFEDALYFWIVLALMAAIAAGTVAAARIRRWI